MWESKTNSQKYGLSEELFYGQRMWVQSVFIGVLAAAVYILTNTILQSLDSDGINAWHEGVKAVASLNLDGNRYWHDGVQAVAMAVAGNAGMCEWGHLEWEMGKVTQSTASTYKAVTIPSRCTSLT